jgi:hypothetical protein
MIIYAAELAWRLILVALVVCCRLPTGHHFGDARLAGRSGGRSVVVVVLVAVDVGAPSQRAHHRRHLNQLKLRPLMQTHVCISGRPASRGERRRPTTTTTMQDKMLLCF